MRILVVDDDPVTEEMLKCLLEDLSHEVVTAKNGVEALHVLGEHDCRLVITDWQMPQMDGLALCRAIRSQERNSYVYLILLTSRSGTRNIVEGLSAGADDFMSKPINISELEVRVRVGLRVLALESANRNLEQVSKLKSDFLAQISHEIRTPLNGIIGMTDIALENTLPEDQHGHLAIIRDSAASLLELITDLLDFSRLDAGKRELESRVFQLPQWVAETLAVVQGSATRKSLEVRPIVDPGIPERLIGDPVGLRQIVVNLLGNAIKFTEEGHVELRISMVSDSGDQVRVRVSVEDSGIGIPLDQQQVIFDAFAQGERYMTRKYGGTGLGLAISSHLVEVMGGTLRVESTPGVGSLFHFTVPLGVDPAGSGKSRARTGEKECPRDSERNRDPAASVTAAHRRILLAEDNAVNRLIAVRMLEKWGHWVKTVENGKAAVDAFSEEDFDLVLMDIQMPEMDGLSAARTIRNYEKVHGGRTPIIALTAHAHEENFVECLAAGMDGVVTKPINREELSAAIEKWSRSKEPVLS